MAAINRDTIVAIILLLISGVLYAETYKIRGLMFDASMGPEVWPRVAIGFMGVMSLVYLVQSVRGRYAPRTAEEKEAPPAGRFLNPLLCVLAFLAFLLALPHLGFFVGGLIFVFAVLTILGPRTRRATLLHLVIALGTVGVIWLLFTQLLRMYLPQGTLLRLF